MPTGNPDCPPDVRRAKKISRMMEERAESVEEVPVEDYGIAAESLPPSVVAANTEGTPSTTTNTTVRPLSNQRAPKPEDQQMSQMAEVMMASIKQRQEEIQLQREQMQMQQTMMMTLLQKATKDDTTKDDNKKDG